MHRPDIEESPCNAIKDVNPASSSVLERLHQARFRWQSIGEMYTCVEKVDESEGEENGGMKAGGGRMNSIGRASESRSEKDEGAKEGT